MLSIDRFQEKMSGLCSNYIEQKFLLAVSGGADSMVLADLFLKSKVAFEIAHVNYHLRSADSDADQQLVEEFCTQHGIRLHVCSVTEEEKPVGKSIQLWARELRYRFFREIAASQNLDFLVTAHHLNDQLETFLINLSRGSGIAGLSGIPANDNQILRPLLEFSKADVYAYAELEKVNYREDFSNQKNDYLRNAFRNQAIPALLTTVPDFLQQFSQSVQYLSDAQHFIKRTTDNALTEIRREISENEFVLDKEKLWAMDSFIIREIVRSLGFTGIEIDKVMGAENGKFFRSKSHEIQITKKDIICQKKLDK